MKKESSKSQIAIFIIIAIIIIILFIFLITYSFDKEKPSSVTHQTITLPAIKENVDSCLERQLKRALIIAGMQGGFIYKQNAEYYLPSSLPDDSYNSDFLDNFEININKFNSTLVHSHHQVYSPYEAIDTENFYYKHSIKEDFEKFILDEFVACIDLKEYENEGFEVIYDDFLGEFVDVNTFEHYVLAKDMTAQLDDKIRIKNEGRYIFGNVTEIDDEIVKIQFSSRDLSSFSTGSAASAIEIVNLNKSINVDVNFYEDYVSADLNFPVKVLSNGENVNTYQRATTRANVRFKQLLELSKFLLDKKTQLRSLDYFNISKVNELFGSEHSFNSINFDDLRFLKRVVENTEDSKKFVYSFIDYDSKILGNPYVFNFGYDNQAPYLDLESIEHIKTETGTIVYVVSKNQPVDINLMPATFHSELPDSWSTKYIEDEYFGGDASYQVTSDGHLRFTAYIDHAKFSYQVRVSDREATRVQDVIFVSGFLDNENNKEAKDCFKFISNTEVPGLFPVERDFYNLTEYMSGEEHIVFGYQLGGNNLGNTENSVIRLSMACMFEPSIFTPVVSFNGDEWDAGRIDITNGYIAIPRSNEPLEIKVGLRGDGIGNFVSEPFKIIIYPASCLGPHPWSVLYQTKLFGTVLNNGNPAVSCCETDTILRTMQNPLSNTPQEFVSNANSAMLSGREEILDADFYFCMDPDKNDGYDFEVNNVWENFGEDITSVYRGHLSATCKGVYPVLAQNLDPVNSGSDYVSSITKFALRGLPSIDLDLPVSFRPRKVLDGSECEFCTVRSTLEDHEGEILSILGFDDSNNLHFSGNVVSVSEPGIEYLPSATELNILCDNDNWWGTYDSSPWQRIYANIARATGPDYYPSYNLVVSHGYCQANSNECSGKAGTKKSLPSSSDWRVDYDDSRQDCVDYYFDFNELNVIQGEIHSYYGWVCDRGEESILCINDTDSTDRYRDYYSVNYYCDNVVPSIPGMGSSSAINSCDRDNPIMPAELPVCREGFTEH